MQNRTYVAAKALTIAIALLAVVISYTHIVHAAHLLGLHGWQAYAAPIFIDGFGLLGLLARSKSFAPETRTLGRRFQVVATLISLAANVGAGDSVGAMVFGGMVVAGYLAAEQLAERMRSVEVAQADDAKAKRSASAKQGAATRKANAAAKAPTRRPAKALTAVA
jgi:hypothetical protein